MINITFDIETSGLNAWYGDKITCICAKDSNGKTFTGSLKDKTEKELIEAFILWLEERTTKEEVMLISHSGKTFDIPFICTRASLNSLSSPFSPLVLLMLRHFDLQDINYRVSLDNMAKLLKCEVKSGTGLQAIKLYEEKKWDELIKYCMQDVNVIEQVYKKYEELE